MGALFAQDSGPNSNARNLATDSVGPPSITQASVTPVIDESIPRMEGDEEFGDQVIVERVSNWYPWSLETSVNVLQTNNAELSNDDVLDDSILRESLSLSFTPNISGNLFFDFGLVQEMYRYDELAALDFDYLRSHIGLFSYLPSGGSDPLNLIFGNGFLFANYSYYRVTDGLFGSEAFTNHSAVLGFQKAVPIAKGHQIYYGVSSDLTLEASESEFRRNEHRAYAGYLMEWTENLTMRVGYVAGLFDYTESEQLDWSHTIEFDAKFVVARPIVFGRDSEIYVNANTVFNLNDSSLGTQDYEYLNWGGGVGFRTSF